MRTVLSFGKAERLVQSILINDHKEYRLQYRRLMDIWGEERVYKFVNLLYKILEILKEAP